MLWPPTKFWPPEYIWITTYCAFGAAGVQVSQVTESQAPGRRVHDPGNPQADASGYVTYSNVSPVEEMVNMISASRAYQDNVQVMKTTKDLLVQTLQLGQ